MARTQFTQEEERALVRALSMTWNAIGDDVEALGCRSRSDQYEFVVDYLGSYGRLDKALDERFYGASASVKKALVYRVL
jgi:hypothetical protein